MRKIAHFILIAVICGLVFYILGEPCRVFFKISEATEVRVVAALPLLFGISFGLAGVLGCAIANLIMDISCGYTAAIFIPGFFIQIIYGFLPALFWNWLRRNDENKFKLDKIYKIAQYMLIVIGDSALSTFLIMSVLKINFQTSIFSLLFANTFFNQFITMVVIGIPYLIVSSLLHQKKAIRMTKGTNKLFISFSINEKLILFFLASSIFISIIVGIANYYGLSERFANDNLRLWSYTYFNIGGMLNLCIWVSLAFLYYVEKNVTRPIEHMSEIAKTMGQKSEIDAQIHEIIQKCQKYQSFTSEIGELARSYKEMAIELEDYVKNLTTVTAEKQKVKTELTIATAIQRGSLPKLIESEKINLYAKMRPALEVGGDFYDFFYIDEKHLALLIADVSGKGVPAALFMMVSKIILQHNLKNGLSPAQAFTKTNEELCSNNVMDMFVSCLCGVIDLETYKLTFANAGHEKPAVMHKGHDFSLAPIKSGFVLGGMPGIKFNDFELQLAPGDIVFTYTDGIPEATNTENEQFGNERMLAALNASKDKGVKELCKNIRIAVFNHADGAPQFDDLTMLAFKIPE